MFPAKRQLHQSKIENPKSKIKKSPPPAPIASREVVPKIPILAPAQKYLYAVQSHTMKKLLPALLLLALAAAFSGCTTKTSKDTSIPWSRPASWEGGIPGMGNPGDQR
jgi:hypothetical protein